MAAAIFSVTIRRASRCARGPPTASFIVRSQITSFAGRNVSSAFDLAQKIRQAKDIQELVRMQTEFVQSQMNVLSEQVKDMANTISKASTDSMKSSKMGGLSS